MPFLRLTLPAVLLAALAVAAPTTAQAAPKRIVALTPFTANTLAGLGVRPVAIGQTLGGARPHRRPRCRGVPTLALSHPNGPNLEQLATRNPQLVLSAPTWQQGRRRDAQARDARSPSSDPRSVHDADRRRPRASARSSGARAPRRASPPAQVAAINAAAKPASAGARASCSILGVGRTTLRDAAQQLGRRRRAPRRRAAAHRRADARPAGTRGSPTRSWSQRNPDVIIAVPHGNPGDIRQDRRGTCATSPAGARPRPRASTSVYVSTGNSLLQAYTDSAARSATSARKFLDN